MAKIGDYLIKCSFWGSQHKIQYNLLYIENIGKKKATLRRVVNDDILYDYSIRILNLSKNNRCEYIGPFDDVGAAREVFDKLNAVSTAACIAAKKIIDEMAGAS